MTEEVNRLIQEHTNLKETVARQDQRIEELEELERRLAKDSHESWHIYSALLDRYDFIERSKCNSSS